MIINQKCTLVYSIYWFERSICYRAQFEIRMTQTGTLNTHSVKKNALPEGLSQSSLVQIILKISVKCDPCSSHLGAPSSSDLCVASGLAVTRGHERLSGKSVVSAVTAVRVPQPGGSWRRASGPELMLRLNVECSEEQLMELPILHLWTCSTTWVVTSGAVDWRKTPSATMTVAHNIRLSVRRLK